MFILIRSVVWYIRGIKVLFSVAVHSIKAELGRWWRGPFGHPCPTGPPRSSRGERQLPLLIALTGAKQVKVGLGRTGRFWLGGTARRKGRRSAVRRRCNLPGVPAAPGRSCGRVAARPQPGAPSAAELRGASGRPLSGAPGSDKGAVAAPRGPGGAQVAERRRPGGVTPQVGPASPAAPACLLAGERTE